MLPQEGEPDRKYLKKNLSTILLFLVFLGGVLLLVYPSFSDYWNSFHQSRAIASYATVVANIDDNTYDLMWDEAHAYNRALAQREFHLELREEERAEYAGVLDVTGTGIMGYIEIPLIKCSLPIYHSTDEAVLQIAVGHLEGTSLPVGGESSHCVLSGHRGLPSARLFTDIDQLAVGDEFMIRTLDETLTYEVDQILIVLPHEIEDLKIEEGKDLCTLVTCTPYGVNSHRLLVRGHRVETVNRNQIRVTADAIQIEPTMVAPVVAAPILFILIVGLLLPGKSRKRKK